MATAGRCHIVVVRHGERLDEVNRVAWRSMRTHDNQHDPPLTDEGWRQATKAGAKLRRAIAGSFMQPPEVVILSSPASRTLETAAGLASELHVQTVTPEYALNCCAAAQMYGVAARGMCSEPTPALASRWQPNVTVAWPPNGDPQQIDQRVGPGFITAVKELASRQAPGTVLVLVTHREGIWELCHRLNIGGDYDYCCTKHCAYDFGAQELVNDEWKGPRPPAAGGAHTRGSFRTALESIVPRKLFASVMDGNSKTNGLGVEALLAAGAGQVIFKRRANGPGPTKLWVTPGVRGVWVDGALVDNGDALDLLCPPVASEGEGDFVRVRTACGVEGWTKVGNIAAVAG